MRMIEKRLKKQKLLQLKLLKTNKEGLTVMYYFGALFISTL